MALNLDERVTPQGQATDDRFNQMMNSPDNADLRDSMNSLERNPSSGTGDAAEQDEAKKVDSTGVNPLGYSPDDKSGPGKKRGGWGKRAGIGGAIAGGGGIIAIIAIMLPNLAIGQFHSVLEKVFSGSSSIQQTRSNQWLHNKIFGGTGQATKCSSVTYLCRITTMSEDEVKTLKENGYELVDKKGTTLKADKNGRYAKANAVREIENPKNLYDTNTLRKELGTNAKLNGAFAAIYPSKIAILRDTIAQSIFGERKLNRNPKTTEGDADSTTEEGRAKNTAKNLSNDQAQPTVTSGVDSELTDAVGEAITEEQSAIAAGATHTGASDVLAVSSLSPPPKSALAVVTDEVKGAAKGIPLDIASMVCTNYGRAKLVVNIARLAGTAAAIAYGVHVFTVFEKVMAGDATGDESTALTNDVSTVMSTFNKQDASGNSGSDSAGYSAYMYNQLSSSPISSPITGGALLTAVVGFVLFFKSIKGVDTFCTTLISPTGQAAAIIAGLGVQAIAAFLSGGTSAIASTIAQVGVKEAAKIAVKDFIKKVVGKAIEDITKEDIKLTIKTLGKEVAKKAAIPSGMMLMSYLVDSFVVPYVAKVATGTITGTDANGMAAVDTAIQGLGALGSQVGLAHAESTLTKAQYLQFSKYVDRQEAQYAAMQRSVANPFDIYNQYSASGAMAIAAAPTLSKLNIFSDPSNIASLPMTILGMFSTAHVGTTTAYAATTDQRAALLEQCQDQDMISDSTIALDIFCNPFVGFSDLNMLENTSPLDVFTYMQSHNQVDDNNQPIPGSDYAVFTQDCITGIENKSLSTLVDDGSQIPGKCVDPVQNAREDIKYFRLATIDSSIDKGLTSPTAPTASGSCFTGTNLISKITKGWEKDSHKETTIALCSIPDTKMSTISLWTDPRYEGTSAAGITEMAINSKGSEALLHASQAAKKEGVTLTASIGYRSLFEQCSIYIQSNKRPSECPDWVQSINDSGWNTTVIYSNHMMGNSLDFVDKTSKDWLIKCMQSHDKTKYDLNDDNRCFGFWNDVWQTENWDEGHFTYDP